MLPLLLLLLLRQCLLLLKMVEVVRVVVWVVERVVQVVVRRGRDMVMPVMGDACVDDRHPNRGVIAAAALRHTGAPIGQIR